MLVKGISTGLSWTVCRLNGLGGRDLTQVCSGVALALPG